MQDHSCAHRRPAFPWAVILAVDREVGGGVFRVETEEDAAELAMLEALVNLVSSTNGNRRGH